MEESERAPTPRAQTPSSARYRRGVRRPASTAFEQGSITPSMTVEKGTGRKELPEDLTAEARPLQEETFEETPKEAPQETVEQKREKIEALKKEANELIPQISDADKKERANEEYRRLEDLSDTFSEDYTKDEVRWVGSQKLEALRTEMDFYNWEEFVSKLKGTSQEDLDKNQDLQDIGGRFDRLNQSVEGNIRAYWRRSEEAVRQNEARRRERNKSFIRIAA